MTGAQNNDVGRWLSERVYPEFDAYQANLFESYRPKPAGDGRKVRFDCPSCGEAGVAYHYIGGPTWQCGRLKHCKAVVSIFQFVKDENQWNGGQAIKWLAEQLGIPEPNADQEETDVSGVPAWKVRGSIADGLKDLLLRTPKAMRYLMDVRKFPEKSLRDLDIGYYPDARTVKAELNKRKISDDILYDWRIIPRDGGDDKFAGRVVGFWEQPDGSVRLWGRAIDKPKNAPRDWSKYVYAANSTRAIPYLMKQCPRGAGVLIEGPFDALSMQVLGVPAMATGGNCLISSQALTLAKRGCESVIYLVDDGTAGRQGVLHTIQQAEPRGINTHFAVVKSGEDDVDAMRRNGKGDEVLSLIDRAITGGEFLARTYIAAARSSTAPDKVSQLETVSRLKDGLLSASKAAFATLMRDEVGYVPLYRSEALRVLAGLLETMDSEEDATQLIRSRYGLKVTLENERG